MTNPAFKPLPKGLEDWLVSTSAKTGSIASVGAQAMLEKYGTKKSSHRVKQQGRAKVTAD